MRYEDVQPVQDRAGEALVHPALFYQDLESYLAGVGGFVRAGLDAGDPVLVAVPAARLGPLREWLGDAAGAVTFTDMTELGRNPGRILAALRDFADRHADRRPRLVGEPIWAGRSAAEIREATRHEALINVAFAGRPVSILCPYGTTGLSRHVLEDAARTHPHRVEGEGLLESGCYTDPGKVCAECDSELPEPEAAEEIAYSVGVLRRVRRWVETRPAAAGLDPRRRGDLVLAVGEAAGNSIIHGGGCGVLRLWREERSVVAEVRDGGRLSDPLAGRRRPALATVGGRGLWMIHQLCDLVEVRAGSGGFRMRLHMDTAGARSQG